MSAVGSDLLGRRAIRQLASAGVITRGINIDPRTQTGTVQVTFEGGEPRFFVAEGVAWDKMEPAAEILDAIFAADVFCFSTLAQRTPIMRTRLCAILARIHQHGAAAPFGGARGPRPLCVLDLNLRPPFISRAVVEDMLRYADVIKLNEAEEQWVRDLCGRDAVRWLLTEFSARLVAVTRAEKGASLYTNGLRLHTQGIARRGGDAVGAGDAFVAALSVFLGRGRSLPLCLERANRLGSWVAGHSGAMPPYFGRR